MELLENIKKKIGQWVFQRDLKFNKRIKAVSNIDDAKSIGILYDATSEKQVKLARSLFNDICLTIDDDPIKLWTRFFKQLPGN